MDEGLHRFWFEFDVPACNAPPEPGLVQAGHGGVTAERAVGQGVGVTAANEADCLALIRRRIFNGAALPPVVGVVRDIDVSTLGELVLNWMEPPIWEGIWYPRGYAESPTTR